MIRSEYQKILGGQQLILFIFWGSFIVSLVIYLLITHFLLPASSLTDRESASNSFRTSLWVIALIEGAVLLWWNRRFLTKEAVLHAKGGRLVAAILGLSGRAQTPQEVEAAKIVSVYLFRKILAFSVAQSIAIYGLVLAFVGRNMVDQYLLTLFTLLFLIHLFPSRSFLTGLLSEIEARE